MKTEKYNHENKRQKVWTKAYIAYMIRDFGIPSSYDAERWANECLDSFDKKFKKQLLSITK